MSSLSTANPPAAMDQSLRRFSVDEYHRMIDTGILDDSDRVELLEGYVKIKMPRNPPHDGTIQLIRKRLEQVLPAQWDLRIQSAVTLVESEPEPDLALVWGDARSYLVKHPEAADVGLVIEVAETSLSRDRTEKQRIYALARIPTYWIVNLVDHQVEEYSSPSGPAANPNYAQRQDYRAGSSMSFTLNGSLIALVAVIDLLP